MQKNEKGISGKNNSKMAEDINFRFRIYFCFRGLLQENGAMRLQLMYGKESFLNVLKK